MTEERIRTALGILVLVAGGLAAAAAAQDEEEKRVEKKIVIQCEGEDCEHHHGAAHQIILDEDGERKIIVAGPGHHHASAFMGPHYGPGGFLGVMLAQLTPELRSHFGAPEDAGVMVSKVVAESPAARAGVLVGDIITAVDGESVASTWSLSKAIRSRGEGETITLGIWRNGSALDLSATLESGGAPGHGMRRVVIKCEDGDDCDFDYQLGDMELDFDCGGAENCVVKVECDGDECDCTINGEPVDCSRIPGLKQAG